MSPNSKPTLREIALQTTKTNPSQLGDPISLKAETSSTVPTPEENGASYSKTSSTKETIKQVAPAPTEGDTDGSGLAPGKGEEVGEGNGKGGNGGNGGKKTLRQIAMDKLDENPSQLGDPISLKAETSDSEPTDQDRGARGGSGKSKL